MNSGVIETDQDFLTAEAPQVIRLLSPYWALYESHEICDCDVVGLFILAYFSLRRPKKWCSTLSKVPLSGIHHECLVDVTSIRLMDLDSSFLESLGVDYISKKFKHKSIEMTMPLRLVDIFNWLTFSGVKHNNDHYINKFMVSWYKGQRPVKLLDYVPTPYEVLTQQANGERVVTMFKTIEELSRPHTSKLTYMSGMKEHSRDPLEFLLHDVRHMEHFTNADSHEEQVGFFHCLFQINHGKIKKYFLDVLGYEKTLWFELEYVISDMNCFSIHLLRYLHAKWFAACRLKSQQLLHFSTAIACGENELSNLFRQQANMEWQSITNQLFTVSDLGLESTQAKEIAYKLNDISFQNIQNLSDGEWHIIRDWFVTVGRKKLDAVRLAVPL